MIPYILYIVCISCFIAKIWEYFKFLWGLGILNSKKLLEGLPSSLKCILKCIPLILKNLKKE